MAKSSGLRMFASILFIVALVVLVFSAYVATVYSGNLDLGTAFVVSLEFTTWIATFVVALAVLMVLLIFLLAVAPRGQTLSRPEPQEEAAGPEVEITCASCGQSYTIVDTGDRPLYHACPHCGHSDVLGEPMEPVVAEAEEEMVPGTIRETPTGERELILRCTNCSHVFPTPYSDERPLFAYCPNCGRKGVLEEGGPSEEAQPL